MSIRYLNSILLATVAAIAFSGCATTPKSPEGKNVLSAEVDQAIAEFRAADPDVQRFFDKSYAYAVFPKVFKAAFFFGGGGGKGEVYEQGNMIGYSSLTQGTFGFSFGGEYFREIVFFRDKEDLDEFTAEEYAFSAQATAVALTSGVAAKADYQAGKAVFVIADKGLMVDASLGGQKFNFSRK